jgi:hypothetical protein
MAKNMNPNEVRDLEDECKRALVEVLSNFVTLCLILALSGVKSWDPAFRLGPGW